MKNFFVVALGSALATPFVGSAATTTNPLGGVGDFYNTALSIGGLLAFGAIVYAAVQYALARGNPGGQSEAREGITQAILGLLLLIGAFLILRTINPALLSPSLPAAVPTGGPPTTSGTNQPPPPIPKPQPPPVCDDANCKFDRAPGNDSHCPPPEYRSCTQSSYVISHSFKDSTGKDVSVICIYYRTGCAR